ncbi:hypothetical protein KSD_60000 [Ktedonobacter sp. SOSP1-85]|uniref:hypothetical protein n=1 Tax=Ktedonobacter sp. SOSP1-85 TaxID=2778367 RepID=UPI0019159219|nr:hypothetical protein [Ktedonobacter sp. SOSP1-85]GHO78229.1 hypothetical protein KSD_60000 [Ktedonobacter sp. SOSP1-85]
MIKITKHQAGASSSRIARWNVWIGYAACAWGLWFVAIHLYFFMSGESINGESQFVHEPWLYVLSWTLSLLLFTAAALFPLALIWRFRWMSQGYMQMVTLILAYMGMIGFTIYEWVIAQELGVALFGAGICILGVVVALVRPKTQRPVHWMLLIATWAVGVGMMLYGAAYVYSSFFQPTFEKGLSYFLLGGMNFTIEGILFVATAWHVSRRQTGRFLR